MMDRTSMFVEQSSEWEDFREGRGNHVEEGLACDAVELVGEVEENGSMGW